MRFRKDSDEQSCDRVIASVRYEGLGGLACMRRAGHDGKCIALMCDAAEADGVCFGCREAIGEPHKVDCYARGGGHED